MSSAANSTSSARPRPIRRGNRAIGPPPGTRPAPTSHCERMAFSRLAKRMSLASASSLPTPVALPRIEAMETTGARLRRTSMSGSAWRPVRPGGIRVEILERREKIVMREKEAIDGTIEHNDLHMLIRLDRGDDLVELRDRLRSEDVQRRNIERHAPVRRQAPLKSDLLRHECSLGAFDSLL